MGPSGSIEPALRIPVGAFAPGFIDTGTQYADPRMTERARARLPVGVIAAVAIATAAITSLVLVLVSARYPLPIVLGARPVPLFAGLSLAAACAVAALASDPSSRHPSYDMPLGDRYLVLAWWLAASVALALLSYAAWKAWGVVAMFASLLTLVKAVQVAGFVRPARSLRIWEPFAAIMGVFLGVVGIFAFLARPNLPPPIQAAMTAYHDSRDAQSPPTRPAPDVSSTGLTLRSSGDVDLGGLPVTLFSYDDREGSRVDIYEADIGFPGPQGSVGVEDPPGWLLESYRLSLRTGPEGSNVLVVSWSTDVVDRIARNVVLRSTS